MIQSADPPPKPQAQPLTLKERSVLEALEIIREKGVESLSLRDVARRLGVSHQAPYKHFPSKDILLAEVIGRCLTRFEAELGACGAPGMSAKDAMAALGDGYLRFAAANPLEYRLMFMTPWPEAAKQLGLATQARAGFDILARRLGAWKAYDSQQALDRDAMFVWSTIHGIASILQSEAMHFLAFSPEEQDAAVTHAMGMMGLALERFHGEA